MAGTMMLVSLDILPIPKTTAHATATVKIADRSSFGTGRTELIPSTAAEACMAQPVAKVLPRNPMQKATESVLPTLPENAFLI